MQLVIKPDFQINGHHLIRMERYVALELLQIKTRNVAKRVEEHNHPLKPHNYRQKTPCPGKGQGVENRKKYQTVALERRTMNPTAPRAKTPITQVLVSGTAATPGTNEAASMLFTVTPALGMIGSGWKASM